MRCDGARRRGHHCHRHCQADRRILEPAVHAGGSGQDHGVWLKASNRRIVTAEIDVLDYEALKAAVDSGVEQLGRLGGRVANAGISNAGDEDGGAP